MVVGVRGGDTLLGFEAARGLAFGLGCCGWSSLLLPGFRVGGCGVGLFFENCIVDASIFVSNVSL